MIKATKASNIIIRVPQKMRRMPARKTSSSGQPSRWVLGFPSLADEWFLSAPQVVDMLVCVRCRPWRRWSPRTSASAKMSQQRRSENVSSCETRNNWHLQSLRWDKRPTAFPMASNGTLFCSTILWCSKRWSAKSFYIFYAMYRRLYMVLQ